MRSLRALCLTMRASRLTPWLVFLALVGGTLWLRAPSLAHPIWNLDEAIHSAVADKLLDGGVLYRDAIDQRTPLSYYVVAGLYALTGRNNFFALHVFTALLVAATAFLLWRIGRASRHPGVGGWAAVLYATLATTLFYQGDANAFNTEWLVAFFTASAALAWLKARATRAGRWLIASGALLGLAFLSKQPALLDAVAPVAALVYLCWRDRSERRQLLARVASLVVGWLIPVALTAAYFAAHGALGDAVYYTWTYNVTLYGPEIATSDRIASAMRLWWSLSDEAPAILGTLIVAAALSAYRLVQRTPTADEQRDQPFRAYVAAWALTSFAGAVSGGRGFEHYFVQPLPALCLLAAALLGWVAGMSLAPHRRRSTRVVAAAVVTLVVVTLGLSVLPQRERGLPLDTSVRTAQFISQAAPPSETLFVWGYHPEFYAFSGRKPASRFVYGSFLTGMIPWTNVAVGRDTSYAIVPGAMDTLLAELDAARPMFFVDCSAGQNRFWHKYPLAKFPALKAFVDAHYVLADPDRFRGQGFDVYLLRDEARHRPLPRPTVARDTRAQLSAPVSLGADTFSALATNVTLVGTSANRQLTGLQLLVDGRVTAGVSTAPLDSLKVSLSLQFRTVDGDRHTLQVRALGADGTSVDGPVRTIRVAEGRLPDAEAAKFELPQVTTPLKPLFVQSLYGAAYEMVNGRAEYFAHAPSTLAFALPPNARAIQGGFGFRDEAFAPGNKSPTDGAEFRIEVVAPSGTRRTVFSRLLQPTTIPADRGVQSFVVPLPTASPDGSRLEFVVAPGPADNAATDWTFWVDLRLETSR